jgi:hypothetical protein
VIEGREVGDGGGVEERKGGNADLVAQVSSEIGGCILDT